MPAPDILPCNWRASLRHSPSCAHCLRSASSCERTSAFSVTRRCSSWYDRSILAPKVAASPPVIVGVNIHVIHVYIKRIPHSIKRKGSRAYPCIFFLFFFVGYEFLMQCKGYTGHIGSLRKTLHLLCSLTFYQMWGTSCCSQYVLMQHIAALQHTASQGITLQRTASYYNTKQHINMSLCINMPLSVCFFFLESPQSRGKKVYFSCHVDVYGVATMSGRHKIVGLFCRISSLL